MRTGARNAICLGMLLCAATLISAQNNGGNNGGNNRGNNGGNNGGQQGECNTGCCNLGNQVFKGACSSFAAFFKNDADTAIKEDDTTFQARVNRAPTPSDSCCVSARSFTQYGCSCNQSLRDAAAPQGFSPNAISVIGRAVQKSICADRNHGGSIGSGGC